MPGRIGGDKRNIMRDGARRKDATDDARCLRRDAGDCRDG
ncbi:MAG: hypothetical protein HLUCCA01_07445 [Bacteroidetes bacterium HLUCCA01]|nr:MAG: hypothetical protein HLUCCA01_07445 [Bacteroidetes bacterium HLUCCA01]